MKITVFENGKIKSDPTICKIKYTMTITNNKQSIKISKNQILKIIGLCNWGYEVKDIKGNIFYVNDKDVKDIK